MISAAPLQFLCLCSRIGLINGSSAFLNVVLFCTSLRYVGGLLLLEMLRAMPEALAHQSAAVLPLAFSAKMDNTDKEVAAIWQEVRRVCSDLLAHASRRA